MDNDGIHVDQLTAKSGRTSLNLFGELRGFTPGAPMFVQVEADHLLIGRDWESRLTGELRELWRKFLPAGELHAQLRLSFDGERWQPEIKLTCINVSYTFYKFPFRVDRATGVVTLRDNHLSMDLKAFAGGRPIKIDAEVDNPGPRFTGAVVVRGENMPVDPNLLAALKPKPQEILRSLNPVGTFDFLMRVWRDRADQPYVNQQLALELNRCSVLFDKFPYPLNNVTGTVQMKDGHWWFDNLQGTNDTGTIFCHGSLKPALDGTELMLHFSGENVPLEEELRDALPPPHQKIWNDFKPRGVVKVRDATVRYLSAKKKPEISFSIEPVPGTTSIEPVHFPYRIENLQGIFSYKEVRAEQEGRVDFDRVRGVHERTPISASGFCQFTSEGAWRLKFDRLTADRLRVDRDRDLFVALPDKLKKVVADLRPTGPIQMDGELELSRVSPTSPLQANWKNLTFDLRQASIEAGVTLDNIDGSVSLTGTHDGAHLRCMGELDVDSLTYRDFQFTEVRGPLWIDDTQFILGEHARRAEPGRPARRATAKLYGGTAVADVGVTFAGPTQYTVQATLTDANLARFAGEQLPGKQKLKGKVGGGITLSGVGPGLHGISGQGQVRLREADIYELPLMVALLNIVSLRLPDTRGFTTSDIDFKIDGEHIYLDRIEFVGDAISLTGDGEMNFDSDVRASLAAIVGRSDWQLPVFKNLMGAASGQILQLHVGGSLANPQIRREAFPGINQALEQLQAEMQPRASSRR